MGRSGLGKGVFSSTHDARLALSASVSVSEREGGPVWRDESRFAAAESEGESGYGAEGAKPQGDSRSQVTSGSIGSGLLKK